MGIIKKIFLMFIGGVVLLLLVSITFFGTDKISFKQFQILEKTMSDSTTGTGGLSISLHNISFLDKIYSSLGEETFSIETEEKVKNILLKEGEFFIDIHDVHTNYTIKNEYFDIQISGIGRFYIDTRDTKKYTVISLNNIGTLKLKEPGKESIITEVFLYPHMGLEFNSRRNKFLKNADLVRIGSVYKLKYYTNSFFSGETEGEYSDFLTRVLFLEREENVQRKKNILDIKKMKVWSFPGEAYIKKYFSLFVNIEKKKQYLKNVALANILDLSHSKKENTELVEDTLEAMNDILPYTPDYEEVLEIFQKVYRNVAFSYEKELIYTKINFSELAKKLQNKKERKKIDISSYFLDSIYGYLDFEKKYVYKNLSSFFSVRLDELHIKLEKKEDKLEIDNKLHLEYFSFFLENIITSRFSHEITFSQEEFESMLHIMQGYISLNKIIYSETNKSKSITLIYRYIDILKNIYNFTSVNFFDKDRSKDGLLLRKEEKEISGKNYTLFKKNIDDIIQFYQKNKAFLNADKQRDVFMIQQYSAFEKIFLEYFLALENYESYVYTYDKSKKDLLALDIIGDDIDTSLSKENFEKYILKFEFLSLNSVTMKIVDDLYYQITDIFVQGKKISFDLYPFSNNKIENITLNNKAINASYKLDNIEIDWGEKIKGLSGEKSQQYEFSRFFVNTFLTKDIVGGEEYVIKKGGENEDTVVVVFKRDKLLGKKGEFNFVKKTLSIDYEDLNVVPQGDVYAISIDNALISLDIKAPSGYNTKFSAKFSATYLLNSKKHQFRKIELSPYKDIKREIKEFELGNNVISLIGSINIMTFEKEMSEFVKNYGAIKSVHTFLKTDVGVADVSIQYSIFSKKTLLKFDYNNQSITMSLLGDNIEKVTKGREELLEKTIHYREFLSVIPKIKK